LGPASLDPSAEAVAPAPACSALGRAGTGLWSGRACSCSRGAAGLGPVCLPLAGLASDSGHAGPAWLGPSSAHARRAVETDSACFGPASVCFGPALHVALDRRGLARASLRTNHAPSARRSGQHHRTYRPASPELTRWQLLPTTQLC